MIRLEDLAHGQRVHGIVPQQAVMVIHVAMSGDSAELFYQRDDGRTGSLLLFREHEVDLFYTQKRQYWSLEADAGKLILAAEAYRINLAHLFDPLLAVHTSMIEPLPHQLTAVYGEMLARQPLRFLLADDPGAGKTVMAGLLIKELMIRGDVQRCLICAPGSLTDQWQDEMWQKFQLRFDILTRDKIEASYSGNPFAEEDQLIIRLDQVARSEPLQQLLKATDWDLIICDEAHKMSATFFGRDVNETKRHRMGKLLSQVTRHFLLMTATPHNGKEEDFQLFLSLIDPDRFEGRYREEDHNADVSDLMRRMVKERLLRFDGRRLFPLRMAYTADYALSSAERELYDAVTEYVREEFNKADRLQDEGRKGTVGFALTVLQRRLASSPAAIYYSLHRRRLRLEKKRKDLEQSRILSERYAEYLDSRRNADDLLLNLDEVDLEELSDFPDAEFETLEIELVDSATAAQTIAELDAELITLRELERQAAVCLRAGDDRKWEELAGLMQDPLMYTAEGRRRKLVIFSEHRDTLDYLQARITTLLGSPEAVVVIHGGVGRSQRLDIQDRFRNDPNVHVLIATDAAGEGINLQRANLMVNYDLPWNPNRIEQRFGRIHRIGQEETCHLWNLVAAETREGHVYSRLLEKIKTESNALNGQVFDVLGDLFKETPLRTLLVQAIREGERPEVRAYLEETVDNLEERARIRELLNKNLLAEQVMDLSQVERIRADMERANARRLQPYYIKSFFMQAFAELGGRLFEREPGRYQVNHVPAPIRDHAGFNRSDFGGRRQVQRQYERICFEKALINVHGKPQADFLSPGHVLLDTVIDLYKKQHGGILQDGAILVDPHDPGTQARALYFIEHTIHDQRPGRNGEPHPISRIVRFVEVAERSRTFDRSRTSPRSPASVDESPTSEPEIIISDAGDAPYLDYRPPTEDERARLLDAPEAGLLEEVRLLEHLADVRAYAVARLASQHLDEVRRRREELIDKTHQAVRKRLTREINYWDQQARKYRQQEAEGKRNARLNRQNAEQRADRLDERLQRREKELAQERQLSASPPVIVNPDLAAEARQLAYRLYSICERKSRADHALSYNSLVISWPAIQEEANRLRNERAAGDPTVQASLFE